MSILAYIDPGSGSLLLQALLAAILSIPFFFRRTIGGAVQRLRGNPKPDAAPDADGSKPSEH
ncbi:MAG TPA: hypothetical protein VFH90_06480 [Candidatus Limnocylindria bacterium]|jgi:hypothetical protein|nr:hypothetical protein [Candidatus Limnocylindria bacterium]